MARLSEDWRTMNDKKLCILSDINYMIGFTQGILEVSEDKFVDAFMTLREKLETVKKSIEEL